MSTIDDIKRYFGDVELLEQWIADNRGLLASRIQYAIQDDNFTVRSKFVVRDDESAMYDEVITSLDIHLPFPIDHLDPANQDGEKPNV